MRRTFNLTSAEVGWQVDVVVFAIVGGALKTLLGRPNYESYAGNFAVPLRTYTTHETRNASRFPKPEDAIQEFVDVASSASDSIGSISAVGATGRLGGVSVLRFFSAVHPIGEPRANREMRDVRWYPISDRPRMAEGHSKLVDVALDQLRHDIYDAITDEKKYPVDLEERMSLRGAQLRLLTAMLPGSFAISDLLEAAKVVLPDIDFDLSNFRKQILKTGLLEETGETRIGPHRPAKLYQQGLAHAAR